MISFSSFTNILNCVSITHHSCNGNNRPNNRPKTQTLRYLFSIRMITIHDGGILGIRIHEYKIGPRIELFS